MAYKISQYNVFFDTNALKGKDLLNFGIKDALLESNEGKIISINYFLPEIVQDEWVYHYSVRAQPYIANINKAEREFDKMQISGHSLTTPDATKLAHMGTDFLRKLGLKIIPTPYDKIDTPSLIKRAVNHLEPFEPVGDKGIKDALIAQTIFQEFQQLKDAQHAIAVISQDGHFKTYLQELIPKSIQFYMFETVQQLQSHVELQINDLSETLAIKAAKLFFNGDDANTFFYKGELERKIRDLYIKRFPNAIVATDYLKKLPSSDLSILPLLYSSSIVQPSPEWGQSSFKLGDTSFEGRDKEGESHILRWSTNITYNQVYEYDIPKGFVGLSSSPDRVTHSVTFEFKWTTELSAKLVLSNPTLIEYGPVDESKRESFASGQLTASGISLTASPSTFISLGNGVQKHYTNLPVGIAGNEVNPASTLITTPLATPTIVYDSLTSINENYKPFRHFWEKD